MLAVKSPYKGVSEKDFKKVLCKAWKDGATLPAKHISNTIFYTKTYNTGGQYIGYPCHAYMQYFEVKQPLVLTELFKNPKGEWNDFYSWLCSKKESPWRSSLQRTKMIKKDGVIRGVILWDTDSAQSAVFTDFLIASRLGIEFGRVETWDRLVKAGINPAMAFWMCHSVSKLGAPYFFYNEINGHVALYPATVDLKAFILGKPTVDDERTILRNKGDPMCNGIWGDAKGTRQLRRRIEDAIEKVPLTSLAPDPENIYGFGVGQMTVNKFAKKPVPPDDPKIIAEQLQNLKEINDDFMKENDL